MARKQPSLRHVKTVKRKGRVYAYFNTGQKKTTGQAIYVPLGNPAGVGFFDRYAACMAGRARRSTTAYTVSALLDEYLSSAAFAKLADNSQKNYRTHAEKAREVWGKFDADNLQSQYVREVIETGLWGAGTCNMVIAVLGAVYRWGRRNKGLTVNPVRDVDRQAIGEHEPWPEDVLEAALASEDATVRLATHLLYFTGQRIGDVCKMRWGDIRDGHVTVRQEKTGKTVEPPLIAELMAELDRTPRAGLTILHGCDSRHVRRKLSAFTASLGAKTVPHGLRKNAVNAFLEAGCTVPEVAAITGQTHQVVEHYAARVNRRKLGKAAVLKFEKARAGTR